MTYRIGVDTGGTFTDLVVSGERNRVLAVGKAPSTPHSPDEAVYNAVELAAAKLRLDVRGLLDQCDMFVHGNTVATNILVEQNGSTTALLCTEGFRDTLAIRRGRRLRLWDLCEPRLRDLVPRHLRLGVRERTDRHGAVELSPTITELDGAAAAFEHAGVEAIAIAFFNSYANSTNEELAADYLSKRLPGCHISASSRLIPLIGEFERTSTAVVDAYVAPTTVRYLRRLRERLQDLGLAPGRLMMAQSNGGLIDVDGCIQRPALTLLSGPSVAASAAKLYMEPAGSQDLVIFDMGGTTCDVTLLRGGESVRRDTTSIGGHETALPSIYVHTVGAGGGTLARVENGMLRVGPESAGSDPGPVCYGLGSQTPAITDANLVLGRLDPDRFAQGRLRLDRDSAAAAIGQQIAEPLGVGLEEAALGMIELADRQMVEAVRLMTVERGIDPRELVLVAAGGAGGLHASRLGRELGVTRTYIPRHAANFCAVGLMQSAIEQDWFKALITDLDALDPDRLRATFDELRLRAEKEVQERQLDLSGARWNCAGALRIEDHQDPILVGVPDPGAPDCLERLAEDFHAKHELLYGFQRPDSQLKFSHLQLSVVIPVGGLELTRATVENTSTPELDHRRMPIARGESGEIAVVDADALHPGVTLPGPLLIHDRLTTVWVNAGQSLRVDEFTNFVLEEETP